MLSNIPNLISFIRLPLTFIFLIDNPTIRIVGLILAMMSDYFDGFLARKYQLFSRLGTFLDPFADKFFVIFTLSIFFLEGRIELWQIATMLSRDIALLIFGAYLVYKKEFSEYQFHAIWCGKIMTTLQFFLLLGLILAIPIPNFVFYTFIILGIGSLIELLKKPEI